MDFKVEIEQRKRIQDQKIAAIISGSLLVLLIIVLYSLGYQIPMPPLPAQELYKDMEMELIPLETLEETGTGGGGSGTPTEAQLSNQFTPQTEQVLTQSHSTVHHQSGASNHSNTAHSTNNGATTQNNSPNPFGGSGGSGGGTGGGNGHGIGNDNGNGSGPGNGNGSGGSVKREIVKKPNSSNINSDEDGKVVLKVSVNEFGDVVGTPSLIRDKSSIENTAVISQVIALVKSQAKWNKAPGAAVFSTAITITLTAN